MSFVCCDVEVSATGRFLVQRNTTDWGVSLCDREASNLRKLWFTRDSDAMQKRKQVTLFNTNPNDVGNLLLRYASLYRFTPSPVGGYFASITKIQPVNKQYFRLWLDVVTCKRFRVMACYLNTKPPLRKCTTFSACKYKLRIETVSRLSFLFITCNSIHDPIKRLCITNSWTLFALEFALGDN